MKCHVQTDHLNGGQEHTCWGGFSIKKQVLTYSDVHDLGDFPQVNKEPNEDADLHHKIGLIVQDVQQHHQRLKNPKYDGAHGQAF